VTDVVCVVVGYALPLVGVMTPSGAAERTVDAAPQTLQATDERPCSSTSDQPEHRSAFHVALISDTGLRQRGSYPTADEIVRLAGRAISGVRPQQLEPLARGGVSATKRGVKDRLYAQQMIERGVPAAGLSVVRLADTRI